MNHLEIRQIPPRHLQITNCFEDKILNAISGMKEIEFGVKFEWKVFLKWY